MLSQAILLGYAWQSTFHSSASMYDIMNANWTAKQQKKKQKKPGNETREAHSGVTVLTSGTTLILPITA